MADLTPTMKLCLNSVEHAPGAPMRELPGGTSTVRALMRRGKVEIAGDPVQVFLPAHEHQFQQVLHLDGCHSYTSSYACSCGVTAGSYGERSVREDPYSAIWMDSPDSCQRCRELLGGARPRHELVIERPADYTVPA